MSGVSGLRAFAANAYTRRALEQTAEAQRHRGHDGHDVPTVWAGPCVGLAHTGTLPGTTADCSQPIHSVDGRWVVAMDGAVLNRQSLRARLDYPFRTRGDAEVVVAGLALEGISFVERLQGHVAIVAHDLRTDTTHLVRDRVGVLPLHYRHVPGGIAFASELKALLTVGPAPQVDHRSLDAYLAHRAVPAPDTLFEGVKEVRPGHRVAIMPRGHVEEVMYWTAPEMDPDGTWSVADTVEAVGDGVREAVRAALPVDTPLGAYLTEDLASSLLVAQAQLLRGDDPVYTFSVVGEGASCDELEWACHVSSLLGTRHHQVRLRANDFDDLWSHLTWHRDAPLSGPDDLVVHALARAAGEHVRVAVSAHGANELFGGHQRYRLARLAERSSAVPGSLGPNLTGTMERRFGATFSAAERRRLLGTPPPEDRHPAPARGADAVDRLLRHDLRHLLPDDVLQRTDRMSAAASIDLRLPMLDHRLVELALRLPSSVKLRSGRTAWALKEVARPLLPDEVIEHRRAGSSSDVWLRSGLAHIVRRRLVGPDSWVGRTLDPTLVRDIVDRPGRGATNDRLWTLLSLEMWHDTFFGEAPTLPRPRAGTEAFAAPGTGR